MTATAVLERRSEQADWPPPGKWHWPYIYEGEPLGLDFLLRVMKATSLYGPDQWSKLGLWTTQSNLESILDSHGSYPPGVISIVENILRTDYPQRLADSFPEGSAGRELVQAVFFSPDTYEERGRRRYAAGFLLGKTVLESLPALHPETVLPFMFGHWVANVYDEEEDLRGLIRLKAGNSNIISEEGKQRAERIADEDVMRYEEQLRKVGPLKEQISAALGNTAIPSSLKKQIPQQLVERCISPGTLELIIMGYRMFGEAVGSGLRERMPLLFLAGLAEDEAMFNAYRGDLVRLYAEAPAEAPQPTAGTGNRGKRFGHPALAFLSRFFPRQRNQATTDNSPTNNSDSLAEQRRRDAERRVDVIREMVWELFKPRHDYNPMHPLTIYLNRYKDNWHNYGRALSELSTLPPANLERHLSDLRQLKSSGFEGLGENVIGERDEGLLPPYAALGRAIRYSVPIASALAHLRRLKESGSLEERILDEFLTGMTSGQNTTAQLERAVATQRLMAMADYTLPEGVYARDILPLLQMDEAALRQGLASAGVVQERNRDRVTAGMLLQALPKLHALFGDKYAAVLGYFEKKHERNDLRLLKSVTNEAYVSEAVRQIELASSGRMQGERLVKLAVSLNLVAELNRMLGLGLAVQIVPDLRISYERAQTALNEAAAKTGMANLDDLHRFMPWLITKDETALRILRGEQVQKFGEPRSYALQTDAKFDPEELKREVAAYARTVGVQPQNISEVSLRAIQEAARYVMAEAARRKDLPDNVLGEVKPNLDRIITQLETAGSNYELSINPQDLRAQMEALQNVTSCLSPNGVMFKYTKEYLRNPNTGWAVIRGKQGIVGRVTIFYGQKEDGRPAIARVSKVYSQVPVSEDEVDRALRAYAAETGREFLTEGILLVPGLNDVYDDFAKSAGPSKVSMQRR